jgi:hypothetical protein
MDNSLIYIIIAVVLGVAQYALGADKKKKAKLRQQQLLQMQQQQQEAQSETQELPSWLAGLLEENEKPSGGFWDMIENANEGVSEREVDELEAEDMTAGLPEEGASAMSWVNLPPVATPVSEPSLAASALSMPSSAVSFLAEAPKEMEPILVEEGLEPSCLDDFSIEKAILYSEVLKPRWKG